MNNKVWVFCSDISALCGFDCMVTHGKEAVLELDTELESYNPCLNCG